MASLTERWSAFIGGIHGEEGFPSAPVVAGGVADQAYAGQLQAYDAAGGGNCSGTPTRCAPLWTAQTVPRSLTPSTPAVAQGVIYTPGTDGNLYAYDAAGVTGCSGVPKMCTPLWTAHTGYLQASPAVAAGRVYTVSLDGVLSRSTQQATAAARARRVLCATLDRQRRGSGGIAPGSGRRGRVLRRGTTARSTRSMRRAPSAAPAARGRAPRCGPPTSPSPCSVVWSLNLIVYSGSTHARARVVDATGTTGCSGSPKSCAPLWTASAGAAIRFSPAVAYGTVYVEAADRLVVFDAAGTTGCAGAPKSCTSLWTAQLDGIDDGSPTVANHVVYSGLGTTILAFDAAGTTGCSGSSKSCTPLWSSPNRPGLGAATPVVVNGTLFVVHYDGGSWRLQTYRP